jgi:hypothetical protein
VARAETLLDRFLASAVRPNRPRIEFEDDEAPAAQPQMPEIIEEPYAIGEVYILDEPLHHHSLCVVTDNGVGNLLFQGSIEGSHWYTITTLQMERHTAWAGTPHRDASTPTTFYYLRVVPEGTFYGEVECHFASS